MKRISKGALEKIELEHQATKLFMRAYEKLTGKMIRHIWHNKPRKPDTSCILDGKRLDLEVAHLYGSEEEAMALLGRDMPEKTRLALHLLTRSSEANVRLLAALNQVLLGKSQKRYKTDRAWLLIRNIHPEWDANNIIKLKDKIKMPETHPFEQIWIIGDAEGKSGIVRLFP